MPATVSESGSARKARGRVAEAPRKATGRFGGLESMPHPHMYTLYTHFCFGPCAKVRRLAEGTRNTPRKGPRKGYNVHRFMREKKHGSIAVGTSENYSASKAKVHFCSCLQTKGSGSGCFLVLLVQFVYSLNKGQLVFLDDQTDVRSLDSV